MACHHVSVEGLCWSQGHQTPHRNPSRTGSQLWQRKIHWRRSGGIRASWETTSLVIVPQDVPVAHPPSSSSRDDSAADAPSSHIPEVIPTSDGSDQESDGAVPDPVADISDSEEGDHRMTRAIQEALQSLDFVDVPPVFLRGMYKSALRVALTEFHQAGRDDRRRCRAWKLLLLLPRLLLFRLARGGLLPKRPRLSITASSPHTQADTIDRRAERLGELSSGRHALEGAPLAPENEETRRALTDERRLPCCEHHCRKICSVFSQSPVGT